MTGLRIVTYNLCEGGQDRVSAIAALLRRQHADVIAFVEANSRANVDTLGHELGGVWRCELGGVRGVAQPAADSVFVQSPLT